MATKILSLDIGSTSIKALLVNKTLVDQTIEQAEIFPRTSVTDPVELDSILKQISTDPRFKADRVVSAIPGDWVSLRFLKLPFKDESKIEAAGPYELEGEIPFEVEDLLMDFHKIATQNGFSNLLAVAVQKQRIRERLELLRKHGLEPRIFSVDAVALSNLICWVGLRARPIAFLDIGASKTSVCMMSDSHLQMVRTLRYGGGDITQALVRQGGGSFSEAEARKRQEVDLLAEGGLSAFVREAINPWMVEVRRTLREFRELYGCEIDTLYLSGGGSSLSGLVPYLSEKLDRVVEPLQLHERLPQIKAIDSEKEAFLGTGLALVSQAVFRERPSHIDLRKGEFEYRSAIKEVRGKLMDVGVLLGMVIFLLSYDVFAGYFMSRSRYHELRSEITQVFQESFPEVQTLVSPLDQMRQKTLELKNKALVQGGGRITTVDLIRKISEAIPREVKIDVVDLTLEEGKVRVKGKTVSLDSVDQIKNALAQAPEFEQVTVSSTQVSFDKQGFEFQITWSLKK